MANPDNPSKKSNYIIWILVAIGVVILLLGIGIYMIWRKSTFIELRMAEKKPLDDLKATMITLQNDIKNRDEKIQKQSDEITSLNTKIIQFEYQVKDIKKTQFQSPPVITGRSRKSANHEQNGHMDNAEGDSLT